MPHRRKLKVALFIVLVVMIGYAAVAGRLLVADHPVHADVILVLGGEYGARPHHGVELLRSGYAPRLILDTPMSETYYDTPASELARKFIDGAELSSRATVCNLDARSTRIEARGARKCLQEIGAHTVLLVTSDYHTRRSLVIFRHELPEFTFEAAAARDPEEFGMNWWTHREWAKHVLDETQKLLWFEAVDRWRR